MTKFESNIVAFLLACAAAFMLVKVVGCGSVGSYSQGQRSGTIVKLSKKGIIWQTWEGELAAGAVEMRSNKSGTSAVPVVFEFSVSDQSVVDAIESAMESGEVVTVWYSQPYVMSWRDGSSGSIVTKVEKHKEINQ